MLTQHQIWATSGSKYSKLDRLIIERIKTGDNTFARIQGGAVYAEAKLHAKMLHVMSDEDRVIDRRLQALRKKGLIHFQSGRWSVVQQPVAAMDSAVGKHP